MKTIKISLFILLSTMLLVACKSEEVSQKPLQGKASFVGSGDI
ncbi:hypothetical protein ACFFHM_15145 [Halalkalibacter kiskunsagensis]|uniref:Uncharacterized protein n=1 Tax=Halalkalibacter kiskunsagensis TaxID=1548599 RepID=A0ABV6KFR3_9BACI